VIRVERILCPVDLSEISARALRHAVALARWYEAEVTVLHVAIDVLPSAGPIAMAAEPFATVQADARRFAEHASAPDVPMVVIVDEGYTSAPARIVDRAEELEVDLLVMGTHGRGGFDRLVLGSTTEKVIRKARCPVLTVPPRRAPDTPEDAVVFKRMLCPIDFSESSARAIEYALSLAQEADAQLTLLHVMEWWTADTRQQLLAEAHEGLRQAVPDDARTWCRPETMVTSGVAHREIVRVAGEKQADLIVMGVLGRNAVDLTLFGSTASRVVRAAACPVLTLRAAGNQA
jgi:nucleotide-binding universal stress UspA family protein